MAVIYIQFRDKKVTRTIELIQDVLFIDLDENDNILGIEVLRPLSFILVVYNL